MDQAADMHEHGVEHTIPKDVRARLDLAAALKAWVARGFPGDNAVRVPRARATLDLTLPTGVSSLAAMKLADLLLAYAYAAGPNATTVRVELRHLAAFLRASAGGRLLRPGEVMAVVEEIAATTIIFNATGIDGTRPAGLACPAIEHAHHDGDGGLTYAIPEPLRHAVVSPIPYVRVDLGEVRACGRAYGVRLVHLAALHAPAADDFRRDIVIDYAADELAAAIGYRRSQVRPSQLMKEAIEGAMADVPVLGNGRRLGFLRSADLGDIDLDGKPIHVDPRLIQMRVFSANPKRQPWPPRDLYTGPGYARETPEGRRRIEEIEIKEALIRRVVDAECDGLTEAEMDALTPQWVREAAEEVRADLAEVDRRYRAEIEAQTEGIRPYKGYVSLGGRTTMWDW
ncbi:hypothetical protein ACHMW5_04070 [Azospirillum melinis]|uniref:hypothetical protein n=1 Tax=Azospirillum melinis TaxID=328839 RepID=UPI003756FB97